MIDSAPGRCARSSSAGTATCRSTAARRCGSPAAPWGGCAAAPTASRWSATSTYAYLPADLAEGAAVEVEVLGEPAAAEVAADVPYDPEHLRVRGW